jgi:hypothetical protein
MEKKLNDELDRFLVEYEDHYIDLLKTLDVPMEVITDDGISAVMGYLYEMIGEKEKFKENTNRFKEMCKKIPQVGETTVWGLSWVAIGYTIMHREIEKKGEDFSTIEKINSLLTIVMAFGLAVGASAGEKNQSIDDIRKMLASQFGRSGAMAMLSRDPVQIAKKEVRECWLRWQADPSRYKGPSAFARDMLDKFEALTEAEVVRRWCREWKKTAEQA